MNQVKSHYEKEASDYDLEFYGRTGQYPILRYRHNYILGRIKALMLPEGSRILDIGCGPGEMIKDLANSNLEIWGIDIAQNMINIAAKKVSTITGAKVFLNTGNIEALVFKDNFFDLVICSGVIEYLADDEAWSREVVRVLKPDGILIINITNKFAIGNWTTGFMNRLKRAPILYKLMDFAKQRILGKGKLHCFPFQPRLHSPDKFDRLLETLGFEKLSQNYFGFSIAPSPFDTLFGPLTIPVRKYLEKFSEKKMILSGTGYIVCAKIRKQGIAQDSEIDDTAGSARKS